MEGHDPCFCSDSPDINYGRLKIEGTEYNLILGPVFSVPLTDELIRQIIKESGISLEKKNNLLNFCMPSRASARYSLQTTLSFFINV